MVNIVGTIRAWHNSNGIYYYWATTDIENPFVDYPISYPSTSTLSDFVLMDYFGFAPSLYFPEFLYTFAPNVSDGYCVFIDHDSSDGYVSLCDANVFDKSKAVGIASNKTNYIRTEEVYDVYCDSTASPGDYLYLSLTNKGMVSKTIPVATDKTICKIGVCKDFKVSATPGKVSILIQIGEPLYIDIGF